MGMVCLVKCLDCALMFYGCWGCLTNWGVLDFTLYYSHYNTLAPLYTYMLYIMCICVMCSIWCNSIGCVGVVVFSGLFG